MNKQVLMCPPARFFNGEPYYQINDWMKEKLNVNFKLAQEQWFDLYSLFTEKLGLKVNLIKPRRGLPDMCFAANCGMILKDVFLTSRFKNDERKMESAFYADYFLKNKVKNRTFYATADEIYLEWNTVKLKIKEMNPNSDAYFEGQGDALLIDEKNLLIGHGEQRTSFAGAAWVAEIAENLGINAHLLKIYPQTGKKSFYHLDTCLCFLPKTKTFVVYTPSFSSAALLRLEKLGEVVPVTYEEAEKLACNMLIAGDFAVTGFLNDRLADILEKRGYLPILRDVSEFAKAGGGVKCLTFEY